MTLVPCKECGTLNSEHAEICLSCEFPTKGRSKKYLWQWVAFGLALVFGLPFAFYGLDLVKTQIQPQPSPSAGKSSA